LIVFLGILGMAAPTTGGYGSSPQADKGTHEYQQRAHVGRPPVHGMQLEPSPGAKGGKVSTLRGGA